MKTAVTDETWIEKNNEELERNLAVDQVNHRSLARANIGTRVLKYLWPILVLPLIAACTPTPTLNSVVPNTGYPRQLLGVDGNTLWGSVVWDVGLATETTISSGLFGTNYFQIPSTATAGVHPVAIRNSNGTSPSVNVTVLAPSGAFPAPRIEEIAIFGTSGTTTLDLALTVSAANLDTDATVTVDGAAPEVTIRWGALPVNYLQNRVPSTFGYPIYHYTQLLFIVENVALGSNLNVTVTNNDNQFSTRAFTVPASLANLDSDADGLLDDWETGSYTAPSGGTVPLSAMGTSKWRKDLLVEVDWIAAAAPNAGIWATIEAAFDQAPVLNPDGSSGVNIIIDRGQGGQFTGGGSVLADHTTMDFGASTAAGYINFFTYKNNNFNNDRLNVFHYSIFGRARPNNSSGRGEIWGNDFMVTFRNFVVWPQQVAQLGTFIHELGHNLGLTHGNLLTNAAQWNETFKPNFPTTMSYRYQFPGVSTDCDFASEGLHTFSQGMFARINEQTANENTGICDNSPLDLNGNGLIPTAPPLDASIDGDTTDVHDDFDQWGNMLLDFDATGSGWNGD